MRKVIISLLIVMLLCCSLPALAAGNTMMFDKNINVVFEGETLQTVLNREGDAAEGEVAYESMNTRIATVDGNGVVTGVARGRTTINAVLKTEKKTYKTQLSLTVARKATSVEVETARLPIYEPADEKLAGVLTVRDNAEENALPVLTLPVKKSYNLQISVQPREAMNRKAVLTSGNEEVLRVRGTSITGLQPGEAVLTIANELSPEVKTQFRVLVVQPVTRITATAPAPSVPVGGQMQLSAEVLPADATLPQITWTSMNEEVATVDAGGVVTGHKRGNVRLVASVADGSATRANLNLKVTQTAEEITLDHPELTVNVGRSAILRATVLPKDTNDKSVVWTSSDEKIATVSSQGRITAVSVGSCEIICASREAGQVTASATVHVQQPVTRVTLDKAADIYAGETGQLTWSVEPAEATNPAVEFSSSEPDIVTVSADGVITGVKQGEAYISAVSTDGTNRRARIRVRILQHVEGVSMKRKTAYVDVRESSSTVAVLSPENASNKNMTWESADPSVATVKGDKTRVWITGRANGETVVTGTTEDGGFQTSIAVKIGDWDHALELKKFNWDNKGNFSIEVLNRSDLHITRITAEIYFYDASPDAEMAEPVAVNTKDGSNMVKAVWKKPLDYKEKTGKSAWQMINYKAPADINMTRGFVRILSYEIDNDWIKTIREKNRPEAEW